MARYNGPGNSSDNAYAITVSPDGRTVFVTGASAGKRTGFEYATVAYRAATGAQLWVARYGAPGNTDSEAHSIAASPNGKTVYVTGYSRGLLYAYATIAYNAATGAQLWLQRYNSPGNGDEQAESLAVSPNGSIVYVTGTASTVGYLTVAYQASNGAQLWAQSYTSSNGSSFEATSVAVGPGGKLVYVTGWTTTETGWAYGTAAYAGTTGTQLWAHVYPTTDDISYGPVVTVSRATGRVYVAGTTPAGNAADYVTIAYSG